MKQASQILSSSHISLLYATTVCLHSDWCSRCCLKWCFSKTSAFSGEFQQAKGNAEAEATLRVAHPRFDALQEQYGPMTGTAAPAQGGTALSASMIEVHLVCVAPSAGKKMGRQTKKVPGKTHCHAGLEGHDMSS